MTGNAYDEYVKDTFEQGFEKHFMKAWGWAMGADNKGSDEYGDWGTAAFHDSFAAIYTDEQSRLGVSRNKINQDLDKGWDYWDKMDESGVGLFSQEHTWANGIGAMVFKSVAALDTMLRSLMQEWLNKMTGEQLSTIQFADERLAEIDETFADWPYFKDEVEDWPAWLGRIKQLSGKQHLILRDNIEKNIKEQKEEDAAILEELYDGVEPSKRDDLQALHDEKQALWSKFNSTKDQLKWIMNEFLMQHNVDKKASLHSWRQWRNAIESIGATDDHIVEASNKMNSWKRESTRAVARSALWINQALIAMQEEINDMVRGHKAQIKKTGLKVTKELQVLQKKEPKKVELKAKAFEKDMKSQERDLKSISDKLFNSVRRIAKQDIYKPMSVLYASAQGQKMKVQGLQKLQQQASNTMAQNGAELKTMHKTIDTALAKTFDDVKSETDSELLDIGVRVGTEQQLAKKLWAKQQQRILENAGSYLGRGMDTETAKFRSMERRANKINRKIDEMVRAYTSQLDLGGKKVIDNVDRAQDIDKIIGGDVVHSNKDDIPTSLTADNPIGTSEVTENWPQEVTDKNTEHESNFDNVIARVLHTVEPMADRAEKEAFDAGEAVEYYGRRYKALMEPPAEAKAQELKTLSELIDFYEDKFLDENYAMENGIQTTATQRVSAAVAAIDTLIDETIPPILSGIDADFTTLRGDIKAHEKTFNDDAQEQYDQLIGGLDTVNKDDWTDPMDAVMEETSRKLNAADATMNEASVQMKAQSQQMETDHESAVSQKVTAATGLQRDAQGVEDEWDQFTSGKKSDMMEIKQKRDKVQNDAGAYHTVLAAKIQTATDETETALKEGLEAAEAQSWGILSGSQDTFLGDIGNVDQQAEAEETAVETLAKQAHEATDESLNAHRAALISLKADANAQSNSAASLMGSIQDTVVAANKQLDLSVISQMKSQQDQKLALKQRAAAMQEAVEQMYGGSNTALARDMKHAIEKQHKEMEKLLGQSGKSAMQMQAQMESLDKGLEKDLSKLHQNEANTEKDGQQFATALLAGLNAVAGVEAQAEGDLQATDSAEQSGGQDASKAGTAAISDGATAAEKVMSVIGLTKAAINDVWLDLSNRYGDKMLATRDASKAAQTHVAKQLGLVQELVQQAVDGGKALERQLMDHATETENKVSKEKTALMQALSAAAEKLRQEQDELKRVILDEQKSAGTSLQGLAGQIVDVADQFNETLVAAEKRERDAEHQQTSREVDLLKVGEMESEHELANVQKLMTDAQSRDAQHLALQRWKAGFQAKQVAWQTVLQRKFAELGIEVGTTELQQLHQEQMEAANAKREALREKRAAEQELNAQERALQAKLAGVYGTMDAQIAKIMGDTTMSEAEKQEAIKRARAEADRKAKEMAAKARELEQRQNAIDASLSRYQELVAQARDAAEAAVASGQLAPSALAVHDRLANVTSQVGELLRHPWVLPSTVLEEQALETENARLRASNAEVEAAIHAAETRLDHELDGEPQLRGAA